MRPALLLALILAGCFGSGSGLPDFPVDASTPGCAKDTDCKGDRICVEGRCVSGEPVDMATAPDFSTPPRFSDLNATVLRPTCAAFDVCHSAKGKQGGMDLQTDAYHALVGAASSTDTQYPELGETYPLRVSPGDPDHSALMVKLTLPVVHDARFGDRMPQANPPLDAATIAAFRAWIAAGSPMN